MKKVLKLIIIVIVFLLSYTLFHQAAGFIGIGGKSKMAKLV